MGYEYAYCSDCDAEVMVETDHISSEADNLVRNYRSDIVKFLERIQFPERNCRTSEVSVSLHDNELEEIQNFLEKILKEVIG
jgi:hypothetical protein